MAILDKIKAELIDIVEWIDASDDTMIFRFNRYKNEIKYGARLVVRESQVAVFVNEGQIADVFKPGTYTLETRNIPILTTIKGWKYGFHSPFKVEIYFASTRNFTDRKWGTKNPIMLRDPEFGPIRLRAFGNYSLRVKDPVLFIRQITGTDGHFTVDKITEQLKDIIMTRFSDLLAESKIPAVDLASQYDEMSKMVEHKISPEFDEYGLEITKFLIENISFPPEVEEAIDKKNSMSVIGNLNNYMQYQSANAVEEAAKNPQGTAGEGIGMGMGFAMANQMSKGMFQQDDKKEPETSPPPVPGEIQCYIVINEKQEGPFNEDRLKEMIENRILNKDTLVWKKGMAKWEKAEKVPEIAELIEQIPPSIP